jgi:predicted molibdopterin-dependent oxidoreductase YjgC
VQRLREAVVPPGEARAGWRVLDELVAAVGGAAVGSASAAFDALAAESAGFRGLSYDAIGTQGAVAS